MLGMAKIDTSKTEWDLSPLLSGDDDPKIRQYRDKITQATDEFVAKWHDRTDYLEDPGVLKEALDELEAWERLPGLGDEAFYFGLKTTLNSADPDLKAKENQADDFLRGIINKLQFFWLSIGNIDPKIQPKFLASAALKDYHHLVERTFATAKYRLSEPEEKILTLKQPVAHGKWTDMTETFLAKAERKVKNDDGKEELLTMESILSLLSSRQKPVRDEAAKAFNDILIQNVDIAEVEINAVLANKKIDDQLRGYERPDTARHIHDDVDASVIDALIETVAHDNETPAKYYALKAKLLGLAKLEYHERNVPYGTVEKPYSFEDSCKLISQVFADLDPEFAYIFSDFISKGQADVYPKKGKRGGAFCTLNGIEQPVYVMLNHTDKLTDVLTIAHEFGHAINHQMMKKGCNGLTYAGSLATAEVASTFMEDFVLQRLLGEADEELRLAIMVDKLNRDISSIHRQVAFYQFEQELHDQFRKKDYLSKAEMGAIFRKHMEAYMGEAVEQSLGSENWWLHVGHFRAFFYVYSYASGTLISKTLQSKVRKDPTFIKEVKKFLAAGTSASPKDLFSEMEIDITQKSFWEQGLKEIDQQLSDTEALATKLGKI
jgi:oligoendopeptidase F